MTQYLLDFFIFLLNGNILTRLFNTDTIFDQKNLYQSFSFFFFFLVELVFKADSFTSFTANLLINHNLSHQMCWSSLKSNHLFCILTCCLSCICKLDHTGKVIGLFEKEHESRYKLSGKGRGEKRKTMPCSQILCAKLQNINPATSFVRTTYF